eukprot:scaffold45601_cov146-Skeletonema_marinoi.AAC.1
MTRTSNNDTSGGSDNVTAWIKMRKGVDQHWVHLDGTLIVKPVNQPFHVKDGSILSLYGATGIAYRVKIESNGAVINSPESVASRKRGATDTTTATNDNGDAKRHKHPGVRQGAQRHTWRQSIVQMTMAMPMESQRNVHAAEDKLKDLLEID